MQVQQHSRLVARGKYVHGFESEFVGHLDCWYVYVTGVTDIAY